MTIRAFLDSDATACCGVVNAAVDTMDGLNDAARLFIRSKNTPQRFAEELSRFYTVVYEDRGTVLGLAALDGNEVKRVYVHPRAQGAHVGRRLLEALHAEARRRAMGELRVEASPSAVPFYERLGYVAEKTQSLTIADAEFVYVSMHRP